MNPEQVQVAIDLMQARGISQSEAVQVLGLVAINLQKSARLEKAARLGVTVADLDGADLGRQIGAAFNAKFFGRK